MYKIDLPVTRCLPGMVTAEPVIDLNTGSTIIGEGQILTDAVIQKLYKFNYNKICVYVGTWNNIWNVAPEVVEKYEVHRKELKAILDKSKDNDILKLFLNNMSEEYLNNTSNERKVIDYLAGMTDRYMYSQYEKYVKE